MRIDPKSILDIGANVGDWTAAARKLWPEASFFLIEANPACYEDLANSGESFLIMLLGSQQRDRVPFYRLDGPATGASVYREIGTDLYKDVEPIFLYQDTLDHLFPCRLFDLIKLDTQGSELDILAGGQKLLRHAKWVILEVSEKPYNQGAPLKPAVVEQMKDWGFPVYKILSTAPHIHQQDLLFYRGL